MDGLAGLVAFSIFSSPVDGDLCVIIMLPNVLAVLFNELTLLMQRSKDYCLFEFHVCGICYPVLSVC